MKLTKENSFGRYLKIVLRSFAVAMLLSNSLALFAADTIKVPVQVTRDWSFTNAGVHFDCNFSGARLNGCEQTGAGKFLLVVAPENEPINPSPWFAFKISADASRQVVLELTNIYCRFHSAPWLSEDGIHWQPASKKQCPKTSATNVLILNLSAGSKPLWVSAWDIVSLPQIDHWTDDIIRRSGARSGVAGNSVEGRPLRYFILGATNATNLIFVIGRQHPPEITGTYGLESFVETIAGDSPAAKKFRSQFQILVVPVVNPDGVEHGHWRSNLGGVDLNRDWRNFSQPETRAVRDLFLSYSRASGAKPWLFLDFHSTGTNIFYPQPERAGDTQHGFTDRWLAGLRERLPRFQFDRDDPHNSTLATGKAWANSTWHIPAMTCEFGYQTSRELILKAGRVEAEALFELGNIYGR